MIIELSFIAGAGDHGQWNGWMVTTHLVTSGRQPGNTLTFDTGNTKEGRYAGEHVSSLIRINETRQ